MNLHKLWVSAVALGLTWASYGQAINSPYSNNGLGELLYQGLPHNVAMGEVGIAMPTAWHINLQNPALLTANTFSTFQVGINGDFRRYETDLTTGQANGASLRYLAMSFPVVRNRWTAALALLPLSAVKYNTFSQDSVDDNTNGVTQFEGEGGLSQLVWANGIRLYKSLTLGVKASYVFGLIDREYRAFLNSEAFPNNYAVSFLESTTYSDFNFALGISYRVTLGERKYLNLGGTYDMSQTLDGTQDQYLQRLALSGATLQSQTIAEDVSTQYSLPRAYGLGISYENLNSFKVGLDVVSQDWESVNEGQADLRNTLKIAAGVEWTPDYQSVNSYLKRTTLRLGFSSKQLPYLVNNTEINDFGINFGASFPVSGYSSMDTAFKFGLRGTTDNNLIREEYFQVVIGATINDRWFIKRRYD